MGAWRSTRHRIEAVLPEGWTLALVGRKASPTPATGYYPMHVDQERRLLERAFARAPGRARATAGATAAGARREGT